MKLKMNGMRLAPLPTGKTAVDVFGDFLSYLFHCTRSFIIDTHANGAALWRAVEHAGDLGITTLQDVHGGKNEQENAARGVAFLMSAWEDAKTFTSEAPPDNRHMLTILSWYIILTLAIKGPELSVDLKELDVSIYHYVHASFTSVDSYLCRRQSESLTFRCSS